MTAGSNPVLVEKTSAQRGSSVIVPSISRGRVTASSNACAKTNGHNADGEDDQVSSKGVRGACGRYD
ncbi:hypothetical protein [Corynebacterium durum]|uniref:hypothetical protein n=1 Tax=Corynebacterium durum TaxID=61592 RepID=UPI0026DBEB78|nr:hypothetical protein [Corynebacterium durum]MDO4653193.1 hypothetical protein [Corynebacterium durum]